MKQSSLFAFIKPTNSQTSNNQKDTSASASKNSKEKPKEQKLATPPPSQSKKIQEVKKEEPKKSDEKKKQNEQKTQQEERKLSSDKKNVQSTPNKKVQDKIEEKKPSKNQMEVEDSGTEEISKTESLSETEVVEVQKPQTKNRGKKIQEDSSDEAELIKSKKIQGQPVNQKKADPKSNSKQTQKKADFDVYDEDEEEELPQSSKSKRLLVKGGQKNNKMIDEYEDYEDYEEMLDAAQYKKLSKNTKGRKVNDESSDGAEFQQSKKQQTQPLNQKKPDPKLINKKVNKYDDIDEDNEEDLDKNSKSKRQLVKGGQKNNKMVDEDEEENYDFVDVRKTTSRSKALEEKNLQKNEDLKKKQLAPATKDKPKDTAQKDKSDPKNNISSNILSGQIIVFTGDFDGISRETISQLVKDLGAKNTGSVSGKTTLLVHGSILEDGRPPEQGRKYQDAKQKGTKIMNQSQFSDYLKDLTGKSLEDYTNGGSNGGSRFDKFAAALKTNNVVAPVQKIDPAPTKKILQPINKPKEIVKFDPKSKKQDQVNNQKKDQPQNIKNQMAIPNQGKQDQVWTVKYAPDSINSCIGNQKNYEKMMEWLHDWVDVVIKGKKKQVKNAFYNRAQPIPDNSSNVNAKACLLSGPPGIGKTTSVRLIAKHMGYEIREWNASDQRSKKSVNNILGDLKSNSILNLLKKNHTNNEQNKADDEVEAKSNSKFIILMDEVDGMSSGDRGGNQALIDAIKNTNVPIFCICNDRMHPKVRSLANHCYDIKFVKPAKQDVAKYMKNVCEKEGFDDVDLESIQAISERFGNDLRQTLNFLEMHFKTSKKLKGLNTKSLNSGQKDVTVMLDAFQASTQLMQSYKFQKMSLRERIELFFIDYDLIPLLIQQNYLDTIQPREDKDKSKKADKQYTVQDLTNLVSATSSIAESDLLSKSVRQGGNWSLLPNFAFLSCIYPCDKVCEDKPIFPRFPEWLGKYQTTKKTTRELREFRISLSKSISGSRFAVKFDYVPNLLKIILSHLKKGNNQSIEYVLDYLEYYNIKPQHLKEHLNDLQYPKADYYGVVSSDIKTKLTKEYNKRYEDSSKKIVATKKQKKQEPSQGKYDKNLDDVVYSDTEELSLDENGDIIEPKEEDEVARKKQKPKKLQNKTKKAPKLKKGKSKKSEDDSLTDEISQEEDDDDDDLDGFIVKDSDQD